MPSYLLPPFPLPTRQSQPYASIRVSFPPLQGFREGDCQTVRQQIGEVMREKKNILDFSWTEVARINADDYLAGGSIDAFLVNTLALPPAPSQ